MTREEPAAAPEPPGIPAGTFSAWLRAARETLHTGGGTDVPCGDCTACCTSSHFIHIRPDETAALARIDKRVLTPAPGMPRGHVQMGYDRNGTCPQMRNDACAIYADRPRACRSYDCRVFAAAGISAGEDKVRINARVERWRFDYPDTEERAGDRAKHDAVKAAARFIRDHAAHFPGGKIPQDPGQLAVLALKVYEVFLGKLGKSGEAGTTNPADPANTARAVVEASRAFDAGMVDPAT